MKINYSQFYSIVESGTGNPYMPGSKKSPIVHYHFPEGPLDFNLLKEVISEVRHNVKLLGFTLEGSEDSPFVQV
jgi:hypothetical protein